MADGVLLNAGSGGVTAATDDCGASGHAQVVKLAVANDGVATLISADTTNGLDVDVTRLPGSSTAALSSVASSAVNQTALSANTARTGMIFDNDCDKIAYIKFGATASSSSYTKRLFPQQSWEPDRNYTGRVDVIWEASPTGSLRVTELSA